MQQQVNSVFAVADVFNNEALEEREDMTPLKLIKLCYIAYGFYLGYGKGKLFREKIEAWKYGPVIPALYHDLKKYKGSPIRESLRYDGPPLDDHEKLFVQKVWKAYKKFSGLDLTNLTHQKGTPWREVYDKTFRFSAIIPDASIKAYYEGIIETGYGT
ncbi:MAG: DUF4065 domain-containing protein [Hyphomicrobiales bacterium]|nr:DUF4065 domain-containing protein [Hyphomicrobiales bacterium]